MRRAVRVAALMVSVLAALATGELALRLTDGFVLWSVRLRPLQSGTETSQGAEPGGPDRAFAAALPLAPGVDPAWYDNDPVPVPKHPDDPLISKRLSEYPNDPIGALFVWNANYVREQVCAGNQTGSMGILQEFLVFDPVEQSAFPIFRHLPNASPPGSFTSNAFGWRGSPLTLEKPLNTIRLAFVGASTTIAAHAFAYSHPEFVGHWLNLWAQKQGLPHRFDVINAGRTGIDFASIEAIVRQEVVPADPDLVIYYEGANQFAPGKLMRMPSTLAPKPTVTFRKRTVLEDYLVSARRGLTALDIMNGGNGHEPAKPDYPIVWPVGVDQVNPVVTQKPLPMDLDAVVANLDRMRGALTDIGGELAVSSFIWLVYPGMRLDLSRDLTIYRQLNDTYWPATYAHMRKTADFQNRVFASYAKRYGLPFFDVASAFPRDPALFGDAIHLRQEGLRLQAWIYLQQLVPLVKQRIESGLWPRRPSPPPRRNPANYTAHLLSRRDILASCGR